MRVNSNNIYAEVGEFDPATGKFSTFERDSAPNAGQPMRGFYQDVGGALVVFYRDAGRLRLRAGDLEVSADESLSLRWRLVDATETDLNHRVAEDGAAELTITAPDVAPVTLRYPSGPPEIPLALDPTPYVEYDHWDFGLFIKNVLDKDGGASLFVEDTPD
jgi:hypothetical protein